MYTPEQVASMNPAALRGAYDAGPLVRADDVMIVRLTPSDEHGWFYGVSYDAEDGLSYGTYHEGQVT